MKIDFHCHTEYSFDCDTSLERVLGKYVDKKINGVVVTDHNFSTYEKALSIVEKRKWPLMIIPGVEITSTKEGFHILAIGVEKVFGAGLPALEVIEMIQENGGLAVIAHPFRHGSGLMTCGLSLAQCDLILRRADGIELNGKSYKESIIKTKKLIKEYPKKFVTVGSDAHFVYEIGRAYLEVNRDVVDFNGLKKALKEGNNRVFIKKRSERLERFYPEMEGFLAKVSEKLGKIPWIQKPLKKVVWPLVRGIRRLIY